jgi:opacity protein-like surface antigen
MKHLPIALAALAASAFPAWAQDSTWEYDATFYLFAPKTEIGIEGPNRSIEGELSFSDALSNLDLTFMGTFAASNGQWSFLVDYMYTDLSFENSTPGHVFDAVETDVTMSILTAYAAYRVHEDPSVKLDLAAGLRWFDTDTQLSLVPSARGGLSAEEDWTNPVIGMRARFQLSDRWTGTAFVDYGGFDGDDETWQALLTADYTINESWMIRAGYRYLTADHEFDGRTMSFTQSGPVIGVSYRF